MQKVLVMVGLLAGIMAVQAAGFISLTPGSAGVLPPVTAPTTGVGVVAWAPGGSIAGVAVLTDLDASAGGFAYVVHELSGEIVTSIAPTTALSYSQLFSVPGTLQTGPLAVYYLIADTADLRPGDPAPRSPYLKTENFFMGAPEPGAYALLAGLGLVGFAAYRRFRR